MPWSHLMPSSDNVVRIFPVEKKRYGLDSVEKITQFAKFKRKAGRPRARHYKPEEHELRLLARIDQRSLKRQVARNKYFREQERASLAESEELFARYTHRSLPMREWRH